MTGSITLSNGAICLVDAEWAEMLSGVTWGCSVKPWTSYAIHRERFGEGRRSFVLMHRLIADAQPGELVDHISGNGLDNRKANLRIVSALQNSMNRVRNLNSKSKYKGVTFDRGKWQGQIKLHGKMHYLGRFDTEQEAAAAYNEAALRLFGVYAKLNQIPGVGIEPPAKQQRAR